MKSPCFISREQMEGLTEQILMDYGFDPYDKIVKSAPIEEIIEFHFDLQICWESIDHLDKDGLVMAAILPTEKQIILNESHRELFDNKIGTYHFTLAHELGHWVLHTSETPYLLRLRNSEPERPAKVQGQPFYCRSTAQKPMEEIQADLFAGCLLMPRPMIERAVGQLRKMRKIHLSHLYGLAHCLRVSISALSVRLTQLQLLTIDQYGNVNRPGAYTHPAFEQLTLDI